MSLYEGFATKAIHAGQDPEQWNHGPLVVPIVMSTTFQQDAPGQHRVSKINVLSEFIPLKLGD